MPALWKTAHVIPLPKKTLHGRSKKDIRPISLTPIVSKIFESIVTKWVDHILEYQIDDKQFGGGVALRTRWLKLSIIDVKLQIDVGPM